ncbi:restriction endonuclease subunit S [Aerococcus urinaeequi]|uniref:restriction endonuclease subunit S n=1 Tax=Aerococcus urinaeequi TaxID=51665 RepID=UPI003D6BC466
MSIDKTSQKAPNLRFKGITDDWEQRKFEDVIISIQTGTNLLGAESNHGIPLIKMGNIQRGFFSFKKIEFLKENEEVEERNMANFGDFLFNTRNTLELVGKGATWFGKDNKFAFNSNIARFTFEGINTMFFNYLYNTPQMIKQVQARAVGTTSVAAVYPKDLNSIKLWVPSESEQEKIGILFRHLDNTITLHQRKLDQLNQLKEALLQQMFPGKGETVPKLRFAGFEGDWEERKLGDYLKIPNKTKVNVQSKDELMTLKLNLGGLEAGSNRDTLSLGSTVYYKRKAGQFIYGKQNFFNGSMAIIPLELDGKATSGDVPSLDIVGISKEYLFTYVSREIYWKTKEAKASGTGSKRIHEKNLQEFEIFVPREKEQQKIGSFFKHLDNTISSHQRKLDQLKNMKQVLLQNMFI